MVYFPQEVQKHMPTTKYTLNIEPIGDHLEVTIPEIGVTVATTGASRNEAIDAAHRAIKEHVLQQRRNRRKPRVNQRQPQAS